MKKAFLIIWMRWRASSEWRKTKMEFCWIAKYIHSFGLYTYHISPTPIDFNYFYLSEKILEFESIQIYRTQTHSSFYWRENRGVFFFFFFVTVHQIDICFCLRTDFGYSIAIENGAFRIDLVKQRFGFRQRQIECNRTVGLATDFEFNFNVSQTGRFALFIYNMLTNNE